MKRRKDLEKLCDLDGCRIGVGKDEMRVEHKGLITSIAIPDPLDRTMESLAREVVTSHKLEATRRRIESRKFADLMIEELGSERLDAAAVWRRLRELDPERDEVRPSYIRPLEDDRVNEVGNKMVRGTRIADLPEDQAGNLADWSLDFLRYRARQA